MDIYVVVFVLLAAVWFPPLIAFLLVKLDRWWTGRKIIKCWRCDGKGYISQADLSGRETCYECKGTGLGKIK